MASRRRSSRSHDASREGQRCPEAETRQPVSPDIGDSPLDSGRATQQLRTYSWPSDRSSDLGRGSITESLEAGRFQREVSRDRRGVAHQRQPGGNVASTVLQERADPQWERGRAAAIAGATWHGLNRGPGPACRATAAAEFTFLMLAAAITVILARKQHG